MDKWEFQASIVCKFYIHYDLKVTNKISKTISKQQLKP